MSTVTPPALEEQIVEHKVIERPMTTRRRVSIGLFIVFVGLVMAVAMASSVKSADAVLDLNAGSAWNIPKLHLPGGVVCVVFGVVVIAIGAYQAARGFSGRRLAIMGALVGLVFILAFLAWASTGGSSVQLTALLQQTLALGTPLILGAMAGIMCERTGVINVAIEGQMLAGAFTGALIGTVSHSIGIGMVAAVLIGAVMGALLAVFSIKFLVNQVILGVVLNVFALGLTGFLFDALMANNQNGMNTPGSLNPIKIPILADIPVIGPLLFNQSIIVYLMYAIVAVIDFALIRTRWGLRTRAVGEHPKAADTVGIDVLKLRYRNVIVGGAIAGLAGAFLTFNVGQFSKGMSAGNGFIALAAVIFGRWTPRGALGAALLFGFASALQSTLSFMQTPLQINSNLLGMLPYLATIFAVAGLVGKVSAPAADGEPYVKG